MTKQTGSGRQRRVRLRGFLCALLVGATSVIAAMTTESVGPLVSGSGAASVIAAWVVTVWGPPQQRILLVALPGTAAVSVVVTFAYEGPARSDAANWWTAETLALMMLMVVGVRRASIRAAIGLAALLTMTITLSPLRITLNVVPPSSRSETLQLCLIWAILAMVAMGVGAYLRNLDARSRAVAAAERRAERLSLARDLHDYAAHDVTAVVVLVEAAQVMAKKDARQALELLPEIGAAGAQALKAMDHTVQLMAETPPGDDRESTLGPAGHRELASGSSGEEERSVPPSRREPRRDLGELVPLVARFNRTGAPEAVLLMAEGAVDDIPAEVSRMGYRVIVEALTNVRRHAASASRVEVLLRREGGVDRPRLRVQITDDAQHPEAESGLVERVAGAGSTGISSLSERVEGLGGRLTAGPREGGGWRVAVVLPLSSYKASGGCNLPNG
ncbi:sensor histidine kinase [Streptomyces sp. NPDC006925]|uniref:sensor histidine kinase n=1 Tax=Streptomyces sp. NPDC006925 TaxID=3364768 RepID=UPI0036791770